MHGLPVFFSRLDCFSLDNDGITQRNCQIPGELAIEGLRAALEPRFRCGSRATSRQGDVLRHFEWGLWFADRLLLQSNGQLRLYERDHDWIGHVRQIVQCRETRAAL
jgi:hypothetical protein